MDIDTKIIKWFTEKEDSKELIDSAISMVNDTLNEYYGPWRYDFYIDNLYGIPTEDDFIGFCDVDEETGEYVLPEDIKKYIENPVTNIQAVDGDIDKVLNLNACHSCTNESLENIDYREFLQSEILYEIGEYMIKYSDELEKLFDMSMDDIFADCLDYIIFNDVIIPEIKKKYNDCNL